MLLAVKLTVSIKTKTKTRMGVIQAMTTMISTQLTWKKVRVHSLTNRGRNWAAAVSQICGTRPRPREVMDTLSLGRIPKAQPIRSSNFLCPSYPIKSYHNACAARLKSSVASQSVIGLARLYLQAPPMIRGLSSHEAKVTSCMCIIRT